MTDTKISDTKTDTTKTIVWFHCFSGIAGDMALGALVDAGADLEEVKKACATLDLQGYEIAKTPTMRNGIAATKVEIIINKKGEGSNQPHRTATDIFELINKADLPERVKTRALKIFQLLAEAEGKLHNQPPEKVHFHEVGAVDSIIDIVGTCAALENLSIDEVFCSPVAHGIGTIECEHGEMPNPPPAVVEILEGTPVYGVDINAELTTPTGAAIVKALAKGFTSLPEMTIKSSGFGAGEKEFQKLPNLTQVIIGETYLQEVGANEMSINGMSGTGEQKISRGQPVALLETNLDDITGEVLANTISKLLEAGALDAWVTPILMKKGRPAHTISVLSDVANQSKLTDLLVALTGTLGVRASSIQRWPQARKQTTITIKGHIVRVKYISNESDKEEMAGDKKNAKPEYDDLVAVAEATKTPLREIQKLATQEIEKLK